MADTFTNIIRKITPAGVVSTLAGTAGVTGHADGTGAAASFYYPAGVAVDASGNVYVADLSNSTIRKITPAGMVSTLAGTAGVTGHADGTGAAASFYRPRGVAVDASGNVYVADTSNNIIRKTTPAGVVSTVIGTPNASGVQFGSMPGIVTSPLGIALGLTNTLYFTMQNAVVRVAPVP